MKKILVISILLTFIVSFGAFAAPARWNALGGEHRLLIDDENYLVYPGRVNQYSNSLFFIPVPKADTKEFYGERYFGDNGIASGALFNVTENMALAFHYNLASLGATNLSAALAGFAGEDVPLENDRLAALDIKTFPDLFWGMKMGNVSLGARFALAKGCSSDATGTIEEDILKGEDIIEKTKPAEEITTSAKALDFSLGATINKTPVGDLDLGLSIGTQSFTDDDPNTDPNEDPKVEPNGTKIESTGGLDIAFNARLNKPLGKSYTLIPLFSLNIGSLPSVVYDKDVAPDVTEVSYTNGDIGIGFRNKIKDKGTLISGVVCGYSATTYKPIKTVKKVVDPNVAVKEFTFEKEEGKETTDTILNATILAGYEFPISDWLTGRGGVNMKCTETTNEMVVQETSEKEGEDLVVDEEFVKAKKSTSVGYYYNVGFGTAFRGITIDVLLKRNIFHRGPYFLTGAADSWATDVCVTYIF